MKTLTLTLLALAATPLSAEEKITTGPPKLEVEAGAQEGPSWDLAGWLYYVGRGQVSRLNCNPFHLPAIPALKPAPAFKPSASSQPHGQLWTATSFGQSARQVSQGSRLDAKNPRLTPTRGHNVHAAE